MALQAGFDDGGLALGKKLADHDPCHALYVVAQNVASLMAESISEMREAKGYVRIAGGAEDEYLPSGPPMSPLTVTYFTMWAMFDVRFGSSRETMGSCILRIAPELDCPSWLIDTVERMQHSRMGFYVHCGSEGEGILLREVGHTGVRFVHGTGWLCRQRGADMVRARASTTQQPVPLAHRAQHALCHPGLARTRLHRLRGEDRMSRLFVPVHCGYRMHRRSTRREPCTRPLRAGACTSSIGRFPTRPTVCCSAA